MSPMGIYFIHCMYDRSVPRMGTSQVLHFLSQMPLSLFTFCIYSFSKNYYGNKVNGYSPIGLSLYGRNLCIAPLLVLIQITQKLVRYMQTLKNVYTHITYAAYTFFYMFFTFCYKPFKMLFASCLL